MLSISVVIIVPAVWKRVAFLLQGWSMEEEVRDILRRAAGQEITPSGGLGSEIAVLFSKSGLEGEIREFRGVRVKRPSFD